MSEKINDMKANILRLLTENAELKRERDEAREVASGLSIQEERVNEAQKELSSIHRWIERNHADGFIDSLTYFQNLERVTDDWYDRYDRLEVDACRFVRERDEARHKLELCMAANSDVARIAKERDEALDQVKELIYIGERSIALAEIDLENDKFGVVSELRSDLEKKKEETK
jgi:regulator of replication initiation timing